MTEMAKKFMLGTLSAMIMSGLASGAAVYVTTAQQEIMIQHLERRIDRIEGDFYHPRVSGHHQAK